MASSGTPVRPAVRLALSEWRLLQSRRRLVRQQKSRVLRVIANLTREEYDEYRAARVAEESKED